MAGWEVRVIRAYRQQVENPSVPWSGKVGLFKDGSRIIEFECHWRVGNKGPFAALPSRAYATPDGERKWVQTLWIEDKALMAAILECLADAAGRTAGFVPPDHQPGHQDDGDDLPF